jgi:UPF0042 nucleotide-binding protein
MDNTTHELTSERLVYILTGLSGAGKSLVSHYLEDQGFYCVDNLPPELIEKFVELTLESQKTIRHILLVSDVRSGDQFPLLLQALDRLDLKGIRHRIIFLEAANEILVRRFSETRRRHPLNSGSLVEDIQRERVLLADVRERADILLDTSNFTVHQLRKHLLSVLNQKLTSDKLSLVLTSFGYKYGIPVDSDLVFDVRFLPNPHYVPHLAPKTGCDPSVDEFIFQSDVSRKLWQHMTSLLEFLIPEYVNEGKSVLTISVGCTGGQHRSVALVERLSKLFAKDNLNIIKTHRDLERLEAAAARKRE